MTVIALSLIVASGLVHSTWNLFVKRSADKIAFLWCAIAFSLVLYLPLFVWFVRRVDVPLGGWACIVASGLLEAIYFALLGAAYAQGDLSLVYPLSRGTAPVLILILATFLLGERVSAIGLSGVLAITIGTLALHFESGGSRSLILCLQFRNRSSWLAILTGFSIALYHIVDKKGVQLVTPFPYTYLVFLFTLVFFTIFILFAKKGDMIKREWYSNKGPAMMVGFMYFFAYLLVMLAMKLANVTYIGAARNINIVIGALMGTVILRERYGRIRVASSLCIFIGVVLIVLAR